MGVCAWLLCSYGLGPGCGLVGWVSRGWGWSSWLDKRFSWEIHDRERGGILLGTSDDRVVFGKGEFLVRGWSGKCQDPRVGWSSCLPMVCPAMLPMFYSLLDLSLSFYVSRFFETLLQIDA